MTPLFDGHLTGLLTNFTFAHPSFYLPMQIKELGQDGLDSLLDGYLMVSLTLSNFVKGEFSLQEVAVESY